MEVVVHGQSIGQTIAGSVTGTTNVVGTNITGTNLKLRIRTKVSFPDEYYYFDNLKVEYEVALPTFTLTTSAINGSILLNPPGGVYTTGTVVMVTANPNIGYAFNNWSGDLAGSTNPTTLTMNGNKSVTATFAAVPTYTLTTSATNGSITLNPPGGVYNAGTVVTVTANPNRGYVFGSWSIDLSGSTNPATITMNGNKSVTANFAGFNGDVAPWLETFTLANGTKTDGPPSSWTATRSNGLFQVSGNRLMINGAVIRLRHLWWYRVSEMMTFFSRANAITASTFLKYAATILPNRVVQSPECSGSIRVVLGAGFEPKKHAPLHGEDYRVPIGRARSAA